MLTVNLLGQTSWCASGLNQHLPDLDQSSVHSCCHLCVHPQRWGTTGMKGANKKWGFQQSQIKYGYHTLVIQQTVQSHRWSHHQGLMRVFSDAETTDFTRESHKVAARMKTEFCPIGFMDWSTRSINRVFKEMVCDEHLKKRFITRVISSLISSAWVTGLATWSSLKNSLPESHHANHMLRWLLHPCMVLALPHNIPARNGCTTVDDMQ